MGRFAKLIGLETEPAPKKPAPAPKVKHLKMNQNWKKKYLQMKNLSEYQIKLLKDGPKSLSQAWALQAMKYDWDKINGQSEN